MEINNQGQSANEQAQGNQGGDQSPEAAMAKGSLEGTAGMAGASAAGTSAMEGHTGEVPLTTATEGAQDSPGGGAKHNLQTGPSATSGVEAGSAAGALRPPVDVIEDDQGITLLADMPGVSRDNLNLRLDAQSLTIEGSMTLDAPQQMEGRYIEVRPQHYARTFTLSRELDGGRATAELAHGVLTIRIPKTQEAAPRRIPVNVARQA